MEGTQANFDGWAIVELFGHQREVGFVTTQVFGQACLFRIDVPEIPERDFELTEPEWIGGVMARAGSKVRRAAVPGRSRLIGPGAIYAINPCTETAAMQAMEKMFRPPLRLLDPAAAVQRELSPATVPADDEDDPYEEGR